MLIQKGLKGEWNSNIVKLMLHNHGFSDKTIHSGDQDNPIFQKIERVIVHPKN